MRDRSTRRAAKAKRWDYDWISPARDESTSYE
jgi:hypothetical protein